MSSSFADAGRAIVRSQHMLAAAVVERHYEQDPSLHTRYGEEGRARCLDDAVHHLETLSESLFAESKALFADYARWAAAVLTSRNIPTSDLLENLRCLRAVLPAHLEADAATASVAYVNAALQALGAPLVVTSEERSEVQTLRALADVYLHHLLGGNRVEARRAILDAVLDGVPIRQLYLDVIQWSQHEIGRRWQANTLSVAEEHLATAITQQVLALLAAQHAPVPATKVFVMACVEEEQHYLGARMVTDFLEMEGWKTYFLGANMPHRDVVETVKRFGAQVLGISATLTVHLSRVATLIKAVRRDPETAPVRILVGGYPFNIDPDVWHTLGADGCAHSAESAAVLANQFYEESR